MKAFLLGILCVGFFTFTIAQPNIWQGGNGDWHDASNWSLGIVPTQNNNVFIPNGDVSISQNTAHVEHIDIGELSSLTIEDGAQLRVWGSIHSAPGMRVNGDAFVFGSLFIKNINNENGIHIPSTGRMFIFDTGYVKLNDISRIGLFCQNLLFNYGFLHISGTGDEGILNLGGIYNDGNIYVTTPSSEGIFNEGLIENQHNISIRNSNTGLSNTGQLKNRAEGHLSYYNIGVFALRTFSGAVTENEGKISCFSGVDIAAIDNFGDWENKKGAEIVVYTGDRGIFNRNFADFTNKGTIELKEGISIFSIENRGLFENIDCGIIYIEDRLNNNNFGTFINNNVLINKSISSSFIEGNFENYGIIEDNPGGLVNQPDVSNGGMFITSVTGTVQVDNPFMGPITVVDESIYNDFNAYKWYDTPQLDKVAGYYLGSGKWVLTYYAIGLEELYYPTLNENTGCESIRSVKFEHPIQSYNTPSPSSQINNLTTVSNSFSIFPNPFVESINLSVPEGINGKYKIAVISTLAQQVYVEQITLEAGTTLPIHFDQQLPTGTYMLTIRDGESIVWSAKLMKHP